MTPISRPWFSKTNTSRVVGSEPSAAVRSAHASTIVRTRRSPSDASEASWSLEKHTTSQRPAAGASSHSPPGTAAGLTSTTDSGPWSSPGTLSSDGKRFSKTTTSYAVSGTSPSV